MPSFFRSPRTLAGWLELDYFRRRRLFRGWWDRSLLIAGLAALVGLGVLLASSGQRTFQAGPLSEPHALFNDRCEVCHQDHGATLTRLWRGDKVASVPDSARQQCHAGSHHNPPHADRQSCVGCHREHRGHDALVRVPDSQCVRCHGNLQRNDGTPSAYHDHVVSFDDRGGHPPFRRWSGGTEKDPGTIRFNHAVHLAASGVLVAHAPKKVEKLECAGCHQQDAEGRFMKAISYEAHCQRCHPLSVQLAGAWKDAELTEASRAFARQAIRHPGKNQSASAVRADLREQLTKLIQGPLGKRFLSARQPTPERRFPLPAENAPREEKQYAWVAHQLAETQHLLFDSPGGCRRCHTPADRTIDDLPVWQPPRIRDRWWDHATFKHAAHRMMACEACHDAKNSSKTSDILLPGLDLCLSCHNTCAQHASARGDCALCHVYHDPGLQRAAREKGALDLEQLLGK